MKHTENETELAQALIGNLSELLLSRSGLSRPSEEFLELKGYSELHQTISELRQATMALASGNLNYQITTRGYLTGAIKALQASLRHLTWQTKMIASGDFSQKVDFMGEFSEAFNSMAKQLEESIKKLEISAQIDSLTGINNRGHFMALLADELERCKRYQRQFSLLMLDIDHFKAVNDSRGHAAGDAALKTIKDIFQASGLRQCDFYGRIGGEEFALVLPETGTGGALAVAEKLREQVAATPIDHENIQFFMTVSIGAATTQPDDTRKSLMKRADDALYQAKSTGRNRVCYLP